MGRILFLSISLTFALHFTIISVFAQTGRNRDRDINLGSSITANGGESLPNWASPSGDFAFGFRLINSTTNPYLLAIWLDKIPSKTVVWYAKFGENNNRAPIGSKVSVLDNGSGLVLTDRQGRELWRAPINGSITSASMGDNGNFVLRSSNNSAVNAWESFNNPTDTILPRQALNSGNSMRSRRSEEDYSQGRFQLVIKDGNVVLNPLALPTPFAYKSYYSSQTATSNTTESVVRLFLDDSGDLYVERSNGGRELMVKTGKVDPSAFVYYRASLDFDGVFSLYSHPKGSTNGDQNWTIVWSVPDDICESLAGDNGSGACGYNSYCVLKNKKPICECPPEYSFIDQQDRFSGCKPNFRLPACEEGSNSSSSSNSYQMRSLTNTDWPFADFEQLRPYEEQDCSDTCMEDCLCAVAIFRDNTCWKKKLPLSNGKFNTNIKSTAFIKVGRIDDPPSPINPTTDSTMPYKRTNKATLLLLLGSLLGTSFFFNLVLLTSLAVVLLHHHTHRRRKNPILDSNQGGVVLGSNLRSFTYKELEEATNGFREEIGRGAFGTVYKGSLGIDSRNLVAIKKLDKLHVQEGEKEFQTEVSIIAKTHHKNLVQLLGFCQEGSHRLLVYEFMSNGSLSSFLFVVPNKPNWYQRNQIVLGIAKGLAYLHEECINRIIHCDIKPQNILLDDYFNARISDFGLAKLLMANQTRTLTGIRGTKGYVAMEWFRNKPITAKVDVYSFGVVLLEVICCRKSVELGLEGEEEEGYVLTDWAYDCYVDGRLSDLVERDQEALNDMTRVEMLVKIAIWCIQEEPSIRPSMKEVLHMLQGLVEVPIPPCIVPSVRT